MATVEEIKLKFTADVEALRASMAKAGASTKEVNAAVRALAKEYKAAEKAAQAAAASAGKMGETTKASVGVAQRVMATFGGSLGATGGKMAQLAEASNLAGSAFGAAGSAAVGAVAGVLAVGAAIVGGYQAMDSLAESTRGALARLADIDGAAAPAEGAAEAVRGWDDATLELEVSTLRLTTALGAGFLPAATRALDAVNDSIAGYQKAYVALTPYIERMETFARVSSAIASGGATEITRALNEQADAGPRAASGLRDLATGTDAATQAGRDQLAVDRLRHEQSLLAEVDAANERQALADIEAGKRAAIAASAAHAAAIRDEAEATRTATAARAAANLAEREQEAERIDRDKAYAVRAAQSESDLEERLGREQKVRSAALLAQVEEEDAAYAKKMSQIATAQAASMAAVSGGLDLAIGAIDAQIAAAKDGTEAQQDQALKAWKTRQGLATASALMDAGAAYMGLLTAFAPLAFGAPIAAAAVVGPSLAGALVSIDSAPAPQFPDGGLMPASAADHNLARVEANEFVVSRRGVRDVGVAELERISRGQGSSGGGGVIVNRYRHRELSTMMVDHLALDTPLSRRLDRVDTPGRRNGR